MVKSRRSTYEIWACVTLRTHADLCERPIFNQLNEQYYTILLLRLRVNLLCINVFWHFLIMLSLCICIEYFKVCTGMHIGIPTRIECLNLTSDA